MKRYIYYAHQSGKEVTVKSHQSEKKRKYRVTNHSLPKN